MDLFPSLGGNIRKLIWIGFLWIIKHKHWVWAIPNEGYTSLTISGMKESVHTTWEWNNPFHTCVETHEISKEGAHLHPWQQTPLIVVLHFSVYSAAEVRLSVYYTLNLKSTDRPGFLSVSRSICHHIIRSFAENRFPARLLLTGVLQFFLC